ncbi:MAG: hypothetical protein ACLQQ0_09240, partial [Limisphaerales bacterium]
NIVRRLVDSRRRGDESGSAGGKGTRLLTSAPTGDFTTTDAYAFTRELEKLHPRQSGRGGWKLRTLIFSLFYGIMPHSGNKNAGKAGD